METVSIAAGSTAVAWRLQSLCGHRTKASSARNAYVRCSLVPNKMINSPVLKNTWNEADPTVSMTQQSIFPEKPVNSNLLLMEQEVQNSSDATWKNPLQLASTWQPCGLLTCLGLTSATFIFGLHHGSWSGPAVRVARSNPGLTYCRHVRMLRTGLLALLRTERARMLPIGSKSP